MEIRKVLFLFVMLAIAETLGVAPAHATRPAVTLSFSAPRTPALKPAFSLLTEGGALEPLAIQLSEAFPTGFHTRILVGECGSRNAFYDPSTRQIALCLELVAELMQVLSTDRTLDEIAPRNPRDRVLDVVYFVLLHEIGHAIIHQAQLPVVGREEDGADSFATYAIVAIKQLEKGSRRTPPPVPVILGAARAFSLLNTSGRAVWGEHSLDLQRTYTLLCYVAGFDRAQFSLFAKEAGLLPERLEECPHDTWRLMKGWTQIFQRSNAQNR